MVSEIVPRLHDAFQVDEVVIGGGNAKQLKELPRGARLGDNANAFAGGFRLWEAPSERRRRAALVVPSLPPRRIAPRQRRGAAARTRFRLVRPRTAAGTRRAHPAASA
jgi:hypothetical protein